MYYLGTENKARVGFHKHFPGPGKYCRANQRGGEGFVVRRKRKWWQGDRRAAPSRDAPRTQRTDAAKRTVRRRIAPFLAFCQKKVRKQRAMKREGPVYWGPIGAQPSKAIPRDMWYAYRAMCRCAPGLRRKNLADLEMARVLASFAAFALLWTDRWVDVAARLEFHESVQNYRHICFPAGRRKD